MGSQTDRWRDKRQMDRQEGSDPYDMCQPAYEGNMQ